MSRPATIALTLALGTGAPAACRDAAPPTAPAATTTGPAAASRAVASSGPRFTAAFHLERCTFASRGRTTFLVLEPGYTQVLEGTADGVPATLTIRVLEATENVGGVVTRVVEERHVANGALVEISRNFFAICQENGSVFYFGELTDLYENGRIVGHQGSWRHGVNGARAGLIMPGIALLGSRYVQEVAPPVALDQAEVTGVDRVVTTPLARYTGVLETQETTPLEPGAVDLKWFAPDVGLVRSGELVLVSAGFRG